MTYLKKVLIFGIPVGLSFAIAAIYSRLDQLLIFKIAGAGEAGIYGTASRLTIFLVLVAASFGSAINPRFTSLEKSAFYPYFKKTLIIFIGIAFMGLFSVVLAPLVIPLLFGVKLLGAVLVYQILILATTLFILSMPFSNAILYKFKKTNYSLIISVVSIISIYLLLNTFIPIYKSIGAAMVLTVVYFFQLLCSVLYFSYLKINENHKA